MTPRRFTELATAHGLLLKQCGLKVIETLQTLIKGPVSAIPITVANRHASPSPLPHIGILIMNGLAERKNDQFQATQEGRDWLAKVSAMIQQHTK